MKATKAMALAKPNDFFNGSCSKRRYDERDFDGIGRVRIQSLTELERKQWQMHTLDKDGNVDLKKVPLAGPRLLAIAVVDENDHKQFTNADAMRLANLDSGVIGRITEWIQTHCGFDSLDIEESVKNSNAIPTDDLQ